MNSGPVLMEEFELISDHLCLDPSPHYVYFLLATVLVGGVYQRLALKIGYSNSPERRAKDISNNCPLDVELCGYILTPSRQHAIALEKRLHNIYSPWVHPNSSIGKEWFIYNQAISFEFYEMFYELNKGNGVWNNKLPLGPLTLSEPEDDAWLWAS